jgi:hypothetical protein
MSGSKINPNTWKGEVRSGGYIARNPKPVSANSPHWKGKYYLLGYGWVWVSGWDRRSGLIRLSLEDMTDDAARKFCQPKGVNSPRSEPRQSGEERPESGQDDIPF